jgi:hypothetical protein
MDAVLAIAGSAAWRHPSNASTSAARTMSTGNARSRAIISHVR